MAQQITSNNQLTSLVSLITLSVQEVLAVYASTGQGIPSLDSVEPGPFDGPVENTPDRLVRAVKTIEAACTQLICTVSNPSGVVYNKANTQHEPACLLLVTDARIADFLVDKPEGMHVKQLAEASGFNDSDKLGRAMRLLATRHVFREVKPDVYANNRLSVKLISKKPMADLVALITEEGLLASARLNETYTTEPRMLHETAFQRATGYGLFDWYKLPENRKRQERFQRAMMAWGDVYGKGFLSKAYPWKQYPSGYTISDIAGGTGHVTMDLLKKNPHFKVILQDQQEVIQQAKEFWAKEYPQAIAESKVEFVPFNFFKDKAIEGCDMYYVSTNEPNHDWSDADCLTILRNVRNAMKPGARLIIHEIVIRSAARSDSAHQDEDEIAPEPLLPNWGAWAARTYEADIAMMKLFNARERTLEEFTLLCEKSDLQFTKMYPAGEMDLIEFIPV
ncbi:S-adenosyl-L-methionine-dependent methyl transferase [Moniliophthora roreri]|nr:S-adenosyl-L-methionine-dependent methyl transferase [Moniliophthora roreri]